MSVQLCKLNTGCWEKKCNFSSSLWCFSFVCVFILFLLFLNKASILNGSLRWKRQQKKMTSSARKHASNWVISDDCSDTCTNEQADLATKQNSEDGCSSLQRSSVGDWLGWMKSSISVFGWLKEGSHIPDTQVQRKRWLYHCNCCKINRNAVPTQSFLLKW